MKTYLVDTNYFLRLLIQDNSEQHTQAYALFEKGMEGKAALYTNHVVFFEIYWVLSSFYKNDKQKCMEYLRKILQLSFVYIENREVLEKALTIFEKNTLDLEDCYNLADYSVKQIDSFATFDKKLLKLVSSK